MLICCSYFISGNFQVYSKRGFKDKTDGIEMILDRFFKIIMEVPEDQD